MGRHHRDNQSARLPSSYIAIFAFKGEFPIYDYQYFLGVASRRSNFQRHEGSVEGAAIDSELVAVMAEDRNLAEQHHRRPALFPLFLEV